MQIPRFCRSLLGILEIMLFSSVLFVHNMLRWAQKMCNEITRWEVLTGWIKLYDINSYIHSSMLLAAAEVNNNFKFFASVSYLHTMPSLLLSSRYLLKLYFSFQRERFFFFCSQRKMLLQRHKCITKKNFLFLNMKNSRRVTCRNFNIVYTYCYLERS